MNCLHISLTLLSCCLCVSVINGQFQKMFGQQTVLDGNTGPSDGKILIKSELDIKTTVCASSYSIKMVFNFQRVVFLHIMLQMLIL